MLKIKSSIKLDTFVTLFTYYIIIIFCFTKIKNPDKKFHKINQLV
jgi:hypothetical protein